MRLNQESVIYIYNHENKEQFYPADQCKEVSCLYVSKREGASAKIVYVYPMPKGIVFQKTQQARNEEAVIHGKPNLLNVNLKLVKDETANNYLASITELKDPEN